MCIKRVKTFEGRAGVMNHNPFANSSVSHLYPEQPLRQREFAETHGRQHGVDVNVGIPVPVSVFAYSGHRIPFIPAICTAWARTGYRFYTGKGGHHRWFRRKKRQIKHLGQD